MQKKILITGVTGFAGSHLAEYLIAKKKYRVSGTYLIDASINQVSTFQKQLNLVKINLLDDKKVLDLIASLKPDEIFHLAALTSPADSFKNPAETISNNIIAQINLFEAIRVCNLKNTRILITSSADIYGKVSPQDLPIGEKTPFIPLNPYSVSKIAQDFLGLQYYLSYKLKIIRVRPFNHIGPRQSSQFVVSAFAKKIAEIEKNKAEPVLNVGNLDAKRDFTDVRDMVRAYDLILQKGKSGDVYNIGSGISYSIEDVLEKLLSISTVKIAIKKDPALFRPSDTPELLCDNTKFKKLTHWEPQFTIENTLKDTLDYWRNIV